MLQEAHSADCDPFGQIDIALVVEARVVRVNELARLPEFGMLTHGEVVGQHSLEPCRIVTQVSDHFVVDVEQCDPRMQIGHEHHVAAEINIGGKQHVVEEAEMFSLGGKILQPCVGPIGDNQRRFASLPIIPPQSVRGAQLTGAVASSPEVANDFCGFVVLDDIVRAISIADPKTSVGRERNVGWTKQVPHSVLARRFHLKWSGFFVRRDVRRRLLPDNLAL